MNIFVTSECPVECAKNLDDKRVVKMVLETAQLLSCAIRLNIDETVCDMYGIYKVTHKNHPSSIWVRENRANYGWTLKHFKALCQEYTKRYNKRHKCEDKMEAFSMASPVFKNEPRTPFANCAANKDLGLSYKHIEDVTQAYQLYLADRWETDKKTPTWYGVKR
jgi:hypothetical protein